MVDPLVPKHINNIFRQDRHSKHRSLHNKYIYYIITTIKE